MAKVKLINGPPCSGKSTFCKKMMKDKDIVYDYDQLSRALIYDDKHRAKREVTHQYVIDFRLAILKRLKIDNDVDTVYFITSKKPSNDLLNFLKGVDYEIVNMEVSKEECLKRLEKDEARPDKETWKKKIEEWFEENEMKKTEKNIPKNKLVNRQFRSMNPLEVRSEDKKESDYIVQGYAMKYEPYPLYEDDKGVVYEEFRKESFENADISDVIMLYDHQGRVFARTSNKTLKVSFDDVGMLVEADLSSNEQSRGLYEDIRSGLITKMSWSFRSKEHHFEKQTRTIIHDEIEKIYDVSAVGIPANNDTEINARDFVNGVIDEVQEESLELQKRKLKLKLKIEEELTNEFRRNIKKATRNC